VNKHLRCHLAIQRMNTLSLLCWCCTANDLNQGCRNPGCQVTVMIRFCMSVPNMFRSSERDLLYITLLVPRIWRWLPDFWKIYAPLT
jgi:hypothetical protein